MRPGTTSPIGPDGRDLVVLVDADDNELGTADKLAVHQAPGRLHRAFSVFLFDDRGDVLLQKRAATKYHFAGRWSNACCSHPRPGESVLDGAVRRCREELGVAVDDAVDLGTFRYRAQDPTSGLVEHELDHVVAARAVGAVELQSDEASGCRWLAPDALRRWLHTAGETATPWLHPALGVVERAGLVAGRRS